MKTIKSILPVPLPILMKNSHTHLNKLINLSTGLLSKSLLVLLIGIYFLRIDKALSQTVQEYQPNIKWGGKVASLDAHSYHLSLYTCFAATEYGGLYMSTNSGTTWERVYSLPVQQLRDVKISKTDPNTIFVTASHDSKSISGGGLWVSHDRAVSWTQVTPKCTDEHWGFGISVGKTNSVVLAGTRCGVYISDNNGQSWNLSWIRDNIDIVATLVLDDVHYVVAGSGDGGIYYSDDGGNSWHNEESNNAGYRDIITDEHGNSTYGTLHHGTDQLDIHALTGTSLSNADVFLTTSDHDIFYSKDYGKHYERLEGRIDGCSSPVFVKVGSPNLNAQGIILYYAGGCNIKRKTCPRIGDTYDFNGDWESCDGNAQGLHHADERDLIFSSDGLTPLLLANDGGIEYTNDGGKTWQALGDGLNPLHALEVYEVTGTRVNDPFHYDFYFGTQDNSFWSYNRFLQAYADDPCCEGWFIGTPKLSPNDDYLVNYKPFSPADNYIKKAHFITGNIVDEYPDSKFLDFSETHNLSQNFVPNDYQPFFIKTNTYIEPAYDQVTHKFVFGITFNKGHDWSKIDQTDYPLAHSVPQLCKGDGSISEAVIYYPIAKDNKIQLAKISGINATTGTGSISYPTCNNGNLNIGRFNAGGFADYYVFGASPVNPNKLFVADQYDNVMKKSIDGGNTWEQDKPLTELLLKHNELRFNSRVGSQARVISYSPNNENQILIGTEGSGILYTEDGGNYWRRIPKSEKITYVTSIYWSTDHFALVSTYGRGIWKLNLNKMFIRWSSMKDDEYVLIQPGYSTIKPLKFNQIDADDIPYIITVDEKLKPLICEACDYAFVGNGHITDILYKDQRIIGYKVSSAKAASVTFSESKFITSISEKYGNLDSLKGIKSIVQKYKYFITGLIVNDGTLEAVLISKKEFELDELTNLSEPESIPNFKNSKLSIINTAGVSNPEYISAYEKITIIGSAFIKSENLKSYVTVFLDDKEIGSISVNFNGEFSYRLSSFLKPGRHSIKVVQNVGDYQVNKSFEFVTPNNENLRNQ